MNTHEPLPDGGLIRKLWFGDAPAYCDHLLRLDDPCELFPIRYCSGSARERVAELAKA